MASSTVNAAQLTEQQVQHILVKPQEQASVFLAAGPRIFDVTAAGIVGIPKLVSMAAPAWHGENELITEVDPTWGEVTLLNGTKSLKSITRFSNELTRSSVVALDAAPRDRMVLDVAAKIDEAFVNGSGVAGVPLGILNYTGVQSMAAVGALTLDKLLDAIALAYSANVDTTRLRWMMPSRTFIALRKLKDTSNQYLLQPDVTAGRAVPAARHPGHGHQPHPDQRRRRHQRRVGRAGRLLADRRSPRPGAVGQAAGPALADFDQQAIRAVARYDAAPLNPSAVIVLRGVTS